MLKYPVYIRSINNLSDARYCAGMGVDLLGFCIDPSELDYLAPEIIQGILGWTAGIKWVAEFGLTIPLATIQEYIQDLNPDFLCAPYRADIFELGIPVIITVNMATDLKTYPPAGTYLLLEGDEVNNNYYYANFLKKELKEMYPLFISTRITAQNVDEIFNVYQPYGICLKGGHEIAPGLKSFDELAEILEAIEA